MIRSLLFIVGGIMATPFAFGYTSMLVGGMAPIAARVFVTTWLWTFAYWGTFYHAHEVGRVFERYMKRIENE